MHVCEVNVARILFALCAFCIFGAHTHAVAFCPWSCHCRQANLDTLLCWKLRRRKTVFFFRVGTPIKRSPDEKQIDTSLLLQRVRAAGFRHAWYESSDKDTERSTSSSRTRRQIQGQDNGKCEFVSIHVTRDNAKSATRKICDWIWDYWDFEKPHDQRITSWKKERKNSNNRTKCEKQSKEAIWMLVVCFLPCVLLVGSFFGSKRIQWWLEWLVPQHRQHSLLLWVHKTFCCECSHSTKRVRHHFQKRCFFSRYFVFLSFWFATRRWNLWRPLERKKKKVCVCVRIAWLTLRSSLFGVNVSQYCQTLRFDSYFSFLVLSLLLLTITLATVAWKGKEKK
jgi:hypothetical protein